MFRHRRKTKNSNHGNVSFGETTFLFASETRSFAGRVCVISLEELRVGAIIASLALGLEGDSARIERDIIVNEFYGDRVNRLRNKWMFPPGGAGAHRRPLTRCRPPQDVSAPRGLSSHTAERLYLHLRGQPHIRPRELI